jgi:tetratricopeptide (TPR) repeat protein
VAWEQGRYRNAANQATRAREVLPRSETRAQLGVMVAEAWFRAGLASHNGPDFRNAADAYAATLDEVPSGVAPGVLMFQRMVAEIEVANADEGKGERFGRVQTLLDQMAQDPRFDAVNRWQAEWNLARALEAAGEIAKASERLNRLMGAGDTSKLPTDLKAQLGWLQANLSFKAGDPTRTLTQADALLNSLDSVDPVLASQIASMTMLLQAQANFALVPSRPADALERLRKLRAEHPKADAAVYSYIVEADYDANHGQLVEAQGSLQKLADDYANSSYAPYALYQAAQYAERRAQDKFLTDAYKILQKLVDKYPKSELVFYARLKQGNLLRLTNDNPAAQTLFEQLVNEFPQHQDVLSAKLALADCHAAQAASDPSHQESAATLYEGLLDQQGAPPDIRAEAGYKYGLGLARRGNGARALEVWGRLIASVLPDDTKSEALGPKGRVWISKTLLDMGDLFEQQHKSEEAREAYSKVVRKALPYSAQAEQRLAGLKNQRSP